MSGNQQQHFARHVFTRLAQHRKHRLLSVESLESRRLLALTPQLVADINQQGESSSPTQFVAASGDLTYFVAEEADHGLELWVTDGTSAETRMVIDINPGEAGSNPRGLIEYHSRIFFFANDGVHGNELWTSDGTTAGTQLVKDITPGPDSSNSYTLTMAIHDGKLFFNADDGEHGKELWKTDGTTAGTQLVYDLLPGAEGSYPDSLTEFKGRLFFSAHDASGTELWSTDGTAEGTFQVIDPSGTSGPVFLTPVGDTLFFVAGPTPFETSDGIGQELYKTDGTVEGTTLVKDIQPGARSSYPQFLVNLNGTLLFQANFELYRSDGTEAGTVLIDINATSNLPAQPRGFQMLDGKAYFSADDGVHGRELWSSDGTEAGTSLVKDINPGARSGLFVSTKFTVLDSKLFFAGADSNAGEELWTSDGTDAGTTIVKDINPGSASSFSTRNGYDSGLTSSGGKLFFAATQGLLGNELWTSDGTDAGTRLVKDINELARQDSNSNPQQFAALGDKAVFIANDGRHDLEPWITDGTSAGTTLVKDINPLFASLRYASFHDLGGHLYFRADDGLNVFRLWRTDGLESGTIQVGGTSSGEYPTGLTASGGTLFFQASDQDGYELWKSDGTDAGTTLVKDIFPGTYIIPFRPKRPNSSYPGEFVDFHGKLFFSARDELGRELWMSDGTEAGTTQVLDLNSGSQDSYPQQLTVIDERLFFVATDVDHGRELWVSDGTAAGTHLVKDIASGGGENGTAPYSSYPMDLTVADGKLYFFADDGVHGRELWGSDGTEAGTQMVREVNPGTDGAIPPDVPYSGLTAAGGQLFFYADNGTTGAELWTSDGTETGTHLVRDINPGPNGSFSTQVSPSFIVPVGDRVAFRADDGVHGPELWISDGTESGTTLVGDIRPGPLGSYPDAIAYIKGTLYFGADDGLRGREPWKLVEVPDPPVAGDFNGNGVLDGADIDMLSAEVRAGTNLPKFDLDRNNLVNEEDRRVAVEDLAQTWFGDADFSQSVDFSDFALLAARFGESGGWQDGDFDGNGLVEFADFVLLANNFGNQKT